MRTSHMYLRHKVKYEHKVLSGMHPPSTLPGLGARRKIRYVQRNGKRGMKSIKGTINEEKEKQQTPRKITEPQKKGMKKKK